MNDNQVDYPVLIIGGGPSGIATALSLWNRGIPNCVIEAQRTPSNKVGEAIPPNAKPLLKKIGIFHLLEDKLHLAYYGNKSAWGTNHLEQEAFIKSVYSHGYLVSRSYFEHQLWEHLTAQGGRLYTGCKLKKVERLPNGIQAQVDDGTKTITLKAKYIVDATGRKASVCHQLGIEKHVIDHQFAIICKGKTTRAIPHQICIETTEKGWWYLAPQSKDEVISVFFTLKALLPSKAKIKDFISENISSSIHIAPLSKQVQWDDTSIRIMPAGTSRLSKPYGAYWIAVGDAAYSYDPISSYGITSALASGYYAGHAIASQLAQQRDAMDTYHYMMEEAFQSYMEQLIIQYELEKRWEGSLYWSERLN